MLLYFVPPAKQGGYDNGLVAVVGADGAGRRDVAQGIQGSWSHDGSAIHVVTEDADCVPHLSDYPAGGGPAHASSAQLKAGDIAFKWSPDDSQVVFFRQTHGLSAADCKGTDTGNLQASMGQDLVVMNSDGTGLRTLSADQPSLGPVTWTPDGKTLVWARWGPEDIWGPLALVNVATDAIKEITTKDLQAGRVSISPDGSKIAYSAADPTSDDASSHAFVSSLDGTGKVSLGEAGTDDGAPVWSPDGSSLALQRLTGQNGPNRLIVLRPAGEPASTDVYAPVFPDDVWGGGVAWSPDGKKIASLGETDVTSESSTGIVVVGADGAQPKTLAGTAGATEVYWQP